MSTACSRLRLLFVCATTLTRIIQDFHDWEEKSVCVFAAGKTDVIKPRDLFAHSNPRRLLQREHNELPDPDVFIFPVGANN